MKLRWRLSSSDALRTYRQGKFTSELPKDDSLEELNRLDALAFEHCTEGNMEPHLYFAERWNTYFDELPKLEKEFLAGNKISLPSAIRLCIAYHIPIPPWACQAYLDAVNKVFDFEVSSWDDVFEKPLVKGSQIAALRKKKKLQPVVYSAILDEIEVGASVDESLFERIGLKFGLGKTLTAEMYYAEKGEVDSF